ncbi:hypothetical protein [Helicobacter mustelae]|nr:hypothetical protein [Helicobacter mustelae]SQH71625.1 Hsr recombination casette protein [Helicobacter mustelae]
MLPMMPNTTVDGTAVTNPAAPVTAQNIEVNIANTVNNFTVDGKPVAGGDLGAEGKPVNLNFDFGGIASSGTAKTFTLNLGGAGNANAKAW